MVGLEPSLDPEANYLRFSLLRVKNPIMQEWKQLCLDQISEYPKLFSRIDLFKVWKRFELNSRVSKMWCLREVYYSVYRDIELYRSTLSKSIYLYLIVVMFQNSKYYKKHHRMKLSKIFNESNYGEATISTMCEFTIDTVLGYLTPYNSYARKISGFKEIHRFQTFDIFHFYRMLTLIDKYYISKKYKEDILLATF